MEPARQADSGPGALWVALSRHGIWALTALLAGCSADLSPSEVLQSTSVDISDSEPRELVIEARSGTPVVIAIAGRGVDVRARIKRLDASFGPIVDAPNRRMGIETLLVEASHPSEIRLLIERNDHSAADGHAEVIAVAIPTVTSADRRRLEAARLDAAGCTEFADMGGSKTSAESFEAAARLHARNGDRYRQGLSQLQAAGTRYARLADWGGASRLASSAADLLDHAAAPELAAYALRVQGAALDQQASSSSAGTARTTREVTRARELLTDAYRRFEALGNSYEAGYAINYRGVSFDVAGERSQARADYLEALELFRVVDDPPGQALSLQSLALQSHQDGRLSDAQREFDEALALIPRDEVPEDYAHTLHNSAWPLRAVGRFDEAIERFYEAAEILRERGDRNGEARALHGLATTLIYVGEPERAMQLLEAASQLRGEAGARREQAISMLALAQLEIDSGQPSSAIERIDGALTLVAAPNDVAQARLLLARAHLASGNLVQARQQLTPILKLELPPTHRYLGLALGELGGLESRAGNEEESLAYFARALDALNSGGSDTEHARTQVRLAEARLRMGDVAGAVADGEAALAQLDVIGAQSLHAESRAAFRASNRDAVEVLIAARLAEARTFEREDRLDRAQHARWQALVASDRRRAELLAQNAVLNESIVPPELLERRSDVYERLAGKRQYRERLLGAAQPDEDRIAELTREIALLRTEAALIEGRVAKAVGASDPWQFPADHPTSPPRVPDGIVVAEFFVGRTRCWLFEIRTNEVKVHELGTGEMIASLAREVHVAWRSPPGSPDDRLKSARHLANTLFGKMKSTGGRETLVVIPDGPLHLVPVASIAQLAWPGRETGSVHVATSLSAVAGPASSGRSKADRRLAVIADPIYTSDDPRLAPASTPVHLSSNSLLTRSAVNYSRMRRLPASAVEAEAIVSLVNDDALLLIGADANRERVANAGLDQYQILHFATHAISDSEDPALAMLALSRFGSDGRPLDGTLQSYEIAQTKLNADLVVLSACETALGRAIAGEGQIGLAHAFMRSGAKSVIATLWQVPDTSTARLMQEFYRQMLVEGRPAASALAIAQESHRRHSRWSDPYYWAGFQLISNGRLDELENNVD